MKVEYNKWIEEVANFAKRNNTLYKLVKTPSIGFRLNYYTMEIVINSPEHIIIISQSSTGTNSEVDLSYLKFEHVDNLRNNFNLSLYRKDFFDRIFNSGSIKTGNKIFDRKFGVYSTNKEKAEKIFKDKKAQNIFLNGKFLIFSIHKNKSLITLKNMESKLYKTSEIQKLLDNFIHILNINK